MLEIKLNKIEKIFYNLDKLEGLRNIFQEGFFPV